MRDKVVIISGCSRGIGQAIAELLLEKGAIVACFSRSYPKWIEQYDPEKVYWEAIDALDYKAMKMFVSKVYKKFGRIDGLVNNAGINFDSVLTIMNADKIHEILSVNVEAMMMLTQQVTKVMLIKQEGSIVNISSIVGGARGYKGAAVYAASKAAIIGFTKSLARELGEKGIRVNAVLPGFVETNMTEAMSEHKREQILRRTPLKRFGQPSEIASVVKFLLSSKASFITGESITADGGNSC